MTYNQTTAMEEEMGFSNGRRTYEQLRQEYERVYIRHQQNKDGTAKTSCLLVLENVVFIGVAKFSNRALSFSRKKGRVIAQGRAELAFDVFFGKTPPRASKEKRREELSFTIKATTNNTVQDIIDSFLGRNEA